MLVLSLALFGALRESTYNRPRSSPDLPLDAFPPNEQCIAQNACSDQVHISLGGPDELVVTFVSADAATE